MVCNLGSLDRCRTPLVLSFFFFFFFFFFFCSVDLSGISLKQERGSAIVHISKSAYYGQGGCGLPSGGSMPGSRNQMAIGLLAACPNRTSCKCKVKHWEWTNSYSAFIQYCFLHIMHTPTDLVAGHWHKWGPSWAGACKSLWCVVIRTHSCLHWLSNCPCGTCVMIYLNSAVRHKNKLTWNHLNIKQQQAGKFWLFPVHFSS